VELDRLGRSLRHLVDIIADLADRRIGFRSQHAGSQPASIYRHLGDLEG
jgi:DNA invertase Pin-like site-specific DNA recombinase